MVKLALVSLLFLACLTLPESTSDDFLPPDLGQASTVACFIGGNSDGTTDAVLQVDYNHQRRASWHLLLARRPGVLEAVDDCIQWYKDLKKPLEKALKENIRK